MKVFSRDFTLREKIMLLILAVFLVIFCYYKLVDQPVREGLAMAASKKENAEIEFVAVNAKIQALEKKEKELEWIQSSSNISIMPSYNNEKKEVALLNNLLGQAEEYKITFTNITREGNQIRREFTLHFLARDLKTADQIMAGLYSSRDRCLIGDIQYKTVDDTRHVSDITRGKVSVDTTATFYETMVGGVEDSGLPKDSLEGE